MKTVTLEDFINRANIVHNFLYNYSKFEYTKSITKSTIICNIHGEFNQNAHSHLQGKGCPMCANNKRALGQGSFKKFLEKANKKFKNKYYYLENTFTSWYENIEIMCPTHGIYKISPRYHLQSKGCPKCAFSKMKGGYSITNAEVNKEKWLNISSIVYLIKLKKGKEEFIKIGITVKDDIKYRFYTIPYDIEVLKLTYTNLYDAVYKEDNVLNNVSNYLYLPEINFKGYTECFITQSQEHLDYVKSLIV